MSQWADKLTVLWRWESAYDVQPTNEPFPNNPIDAIYRKVIIKKREREQNGMV